MIYRSVARGYATGIFLRPPLPARHAHRFARIPRFQLSTLRFLVGLLALGVVATPAPGETIGFEGFPDSTILTTQSPGLTFTNAIILTSGISLNEFEFPPHSGVNVVSDNNGPMTIDFSSLITSFSGYFTYLEPLTLDAFNASDTEVATATSKFSNNTACLGGPPCFGDPGSSPNEFIELGFAGGISSVTITGDPLGGSITMDDMSYSSAVPEPNTRALLTCAIILSLFLKRKSKAPITKS
jgi:hypothetical protein